MYVCIQTMRHVLKQPSFPATMNTAYSNYHMEITVEEFAAKYAVSHRAGLCVAVQGKETVKIQVFSHSAMNQMKSSVQVTITCFVFSLAFVLYCLASGIAGALYGGGIGISYSF